MKKQCVLNITFDVIAMTKIDYFDRKGWVINSEEDGLKKGYMIKDTISTEAHDINERWVTEAEFEAMSIIPSKSFGNTCASSATKNVKDIVFWGDGDTFKLISKASSENEGWMKSTKAMEIYGIGCVLQVTTKQGNNVAEALTFLPHTKIQEIKDINGSIINRKIVSVNA